MSRRCKPQRPAISEGRLRLALVGEAPGKDEVTGGRPFLGKAGQELTRILAEGGIDRRECYLTNLFMSRPPGNKLKAWCDGKRNVNEQYKDWLVNPVYTNAGKEEMAQMDTWMADIDWPTKYTFDKMKQGEYLRPEYLWELARLKAELIKADPNMVIALGAPACWALLGVSGIRKHRGTVEYSTLIPGLKVFPTYHPAYILRSWDQRAVMVADMMKASRMLDDRKIHRPRREIWIRPTLEDIRVFFHRYLENASVISCDIETHSRQITCIGFAATPEVALVIPFFNIHADFAKVSTLSSWTKSEEILAWEWVTRILDLPADKLFQNGMYDMQYLWRVHGIPTRNANMDTMLLHHSIQPEMEKSLGFLASLYADPNEGSWKWMRKEAKNKADKKDQ